MAEKSDGKGFIEGWSEELTNQNPPRAHPKLFPSKWSQCDLVCGDWHTRNVPSLLTLCPQAIPMLLIIAGDIEENPGPSKLNGWSKELTNQIPPRAHPKLFPSKWSQCDLVCGDWHTRNVPSLLALCPQAIPMLLIIAGDIEENPGPPKLNGWSKELTNQIPPRAHPKLFPSKWSQCDLMCGDWHTRNVPSLLALCPQAIPMLLIIAGDIEENPGPPKLNGWSKELTNQIPPRAHPKLFPSKWSQCDLVCGDWHTRNVPSLLALCPQVTTMLLIIAGDIEENPGPPKLNGWSKELTNQIPPRAHPELFPSKWSQCDLVCGDWHTRNVPSLLALCPQVIPMLLIIAGDIEENPGPPKINGWSEELTNQIPPRAHPKLFPSKWSLCDLVCGDWHTRNVPSLLALCPQVIPMLLIIAGDIEENPGPPKINGWSEELTNQIPPRAHPELFTSTSKWCQCDLVCRDWHTRNVPSLLARCPQVIPMLLIIAGDIEENPGPPKQRGQKGGDYHGGSSTSRLDDHLGDENKFEILKHLKKVSKKDDLLSLGQGLGLDSKVLRRSMNSETFLDDLVGDWLERKHRVDKVGAPTWRKLIEVLREVGQNGLANDLKKEFPKELLKEHTHHTLSRSSEDPSESSQSESTEFSGTTSLAGIDGSTALANQPPHSQVYGCGCGNCTFQSFLDREMYCSKPISCIKGFPYLNVSGLTTDEKNKLVGRLITDYQQINDSFQDLLADTCDSLEKEGVTPKHLAKCCLTLEALDPVCQTKLTTDGPPTIFRDRVEEMKKSTDIIDVFIILRDYFSFFNYHTLERLIARLGTDGDRSRLQKYKQELKDYCKRNIFECIPILSLPSKSDHSVLGIKLGEQFKKFTLEQLQYLKYNISKITGITEPALLVLYVEEGCLQITFLIPSFLEELVFPLSADQETALLGENVLCLKCGGYYYPRSSIFRTCSEGDLDALKSLLDRMPQNMEWLDEEGNTPLHQACKYDQMQVVKFLAFEKLFNMNCQNKNGFAPLHLACELDYHDTVKILIDSQMCDVNIQSNAGFTALHAATIHGSIHAVRILIRSRSCDPNVEDEYGNTSLHVAVGTDKGDICELILNNDHINPNIANSDGNTPLHLAAYQGKAEMCNLLLHKDNIDCNLTNHEGDTPLHLACRSNHSDVVELLTSRPGCIVNVQNATGDMPLHIACYRRSISMIALLLKQEYDTTPSNNKGESPQTIPLNDSGDCLLHSVCQMTDIDPDALESIINRMSWDVNHWDPLGNTPLHTAIIHGNAHAVRILIRSSSCDPNIEDEHGNTPLHAAIGTDNSDICELILSSEHTDPNPVNSDGNTSLHLTVNRGNTKICELLLSHSQTNPNVTNRDDNTPLHLAAYQGKAEMCNLLLRKDNTDQLTNRQGNTPLHLASMQENVDSTEILVGDRQCNPNHKNKNGDTPLHIAARTSNAEVCKLIMASKLCNPNLRNSKGYTPLHIALTVYYVISPVQYEKTSLSVIHEVLCGSSAVHKTPQLTRPHLKPAHAEASKEDNMEILEVLATDERCDPNLRDEEGETPLHYAIKAHKASTAILILQSRKCNPSLPDFDGNTPLHLACMAVKHDPNMLQVARSLLFSKSTNLLNMNGDTPLHLACQGENLSIVKCLITEQHCDVNVQNKNGDSPLHVACYKKSLDIIKFLLQQKCDTMVRYRGDQCPQTIALNKDGDLLLHIACQWGDVDIVRYLVREQLCYMDVPNKNGDTPLLVACYCKAFDCIKFLLQHRCDTTVRNKRGQSPQTIPLNEDGDLLLHIACQWGDVDIIEFLLQQSCDTRVQNKRGQSPQTIPLNEDGDLLLHIACQWGDVDIVRYLVCEQYCDTNVQNKNGDSPLHVACYKKSLDIIKFLLQQRCDTMVRYRGDQCPQTIALNKDGDLLLHIACQWGDVDIVRYLVREQLCYMDVPNKNGDTPLLVACYCKAFDCIKFLLQHRCDTTVRNKRGQSPQTIPLNEDGDLLLHIACQWGDVDIIKYLLRQRCDTRVQNKRGQSPQTIPLNEDGDLLLHIACQWGDVDIVRYLVCEQHCDTNVQNKNGDSPLHIACYYKAFDCIKFLLQHRCDTKVRNKRGQSPQTTPLNEDGDLLLHIACQWGDVDIVRYLVCKQHCDVNIRNKNGDSPLHIACYYKAFDCIKCLLQQRCGTTFQNVMGQSPQTIPLNKNGDLLLHFACRWGDVDIVRYLVCEQHCDVNIRNKNGDSPLHVAIVSCQPSTALFLLQQEQCRPTLPDSDGNTPLHLACMKCPNVEGNTEMLQVARFLLSSTDLSACVNNAGQIPVELITNYQLIQDISHITECKTKHSIQTYIKMFFIGNPSTGKSTLVKAITSESSWLWRFLPHWSRRVRHIPIHTAGIIPITFRSKTFGNTVLYDMAGKYEYYTSHAAVIENSVLSTPPMFVVVVDLSESDDKIMEKLKYWWSFIDNHAAQSIVPPHVILVGSHADVVKARGVSVQEKMSTISSALQGVSSSFHFVGQGALDCRDPVSSELDQFCSLVDQSCTALRQTADIDLRCHVAYSFLLERFEGRVACTLSEIAAQITATGTLLPQSSDDLCHLVESLSDLGIILCIKNYTCVEKSWVILQKEPVLSEVLGTIFAPENFREHRDFARSTGVVPFSRIRQEFSQYDPAMIVDFLTHLEFCFTIDDPEALRRIEGKASKDQTKLDLSYKYYFFPALVSIHNPHRVWEQDDSMRYQCGWYYQCHPDKFLTTRFLHVLILRLAFSFTVGLGLYHSSHNAPALCRHCSVWKHGIGWLQDGIETVVEVGLQCQWVTVIVRCPKVKEVKCVQRRSAVIQEVKKARSKLCKAVRMTEFLIHPSHIQYPFSDDHVSLYSLTSVANAIAKKETHVEDQHGYKPIPLCDLVLFEPYLGVGPELLNELFHQDNSDKVVSETFLAHLASCMHPQMSLFEEVLDPQPAMRYQEELEKESLPASKYLVLLKWMLRQLEKPTYENFHKELDKFSIFNGRNPTQLTDRVYKEIGIKFHQTGHAVSFPVQGQLHLKEVNLEVRTSWFPLGIELGIELSVLKRIYENVAGDTTKCTTEVLKVWIKNGVDVSWKRLSRALHSIGYDNLAQSLAQRDEEQQEGKPTMKHTPSEKGDRPTIMKLDRFRGRERRINIPQEISRKYRELGIFLLEDKTGEKIRKIAEVNRHHPEEISRDVLQQWIGGEGKPATWETLVEALHDIDLAKLASEIDAVKVGALKRSIH